MRTRHRLGDNNDFDLATAQASVLTLPAETSTRRTATQWQVGITKRIIWPRDKV